MNSGSQDAEPPQFQLIVSSPQFGRAGELDGITRISWSIGKTTKRCMGNRVARQPEASKPLFSFKHLIFGSYWLPRLFCLLSESLCLNIASFCGRFMFQRGYYAFRRLRQKWASNTLIINTNALQIASEIVVCPTWAKTRKNTYSQNL